MKSNEIAKMLPEVFQECLSLPHLAKDVENRSTSLSPMDALLGIAELFTEPIDQEHATFSSRFRPDLCDPSFLRFLATWLNVRDIVDLMVPIEKSRTDSIELTDLEQRARRLVAEAASLSQERGTAQCLQRVLGIITGIDGFEVAERYSEIGEIMPFEYVIVCPVGTKRYRSMIEKVVEREKPAHIVCEIVYRWAVNEA